MVQGAHSPPVTAARRSPARYAIPARLGLAVALLVAVAPGARAQGVKVQFSTRVATGDKPQVTFVATEPLSGLSVELRDDAGRETRARFGALGKGAPARSPCRQSPAAAATAGGWWSPAGARRGEPAPFEAVVAPRLEIRIDRARVDLGARRLQARFSRPAARAEIKVFGATGGTALAEATQELGGAAAGTPLVIQWPATTGGDVGRIDLRLHDTDGFYAGVALFPWSVHIPHEEVGFATDSAGIAAAEEPKLEASLGLITAALARHRDLGPIRLYIAGHTDTVGPAYNLDLSHRRAQAIAAWFRKRGLRLPILFEGFGEHALLVATADETDEPRNRRVDYILAVEDPVLKAAAFRQLETRTVRRPPHPAGADPPTRYSPPSRGAVRA